MRPTLVKIGVIFVVLTLLFSVTPVSTYAQTAAPLPQSKEELQALIQILLARLAELQAQVATRAGTGYTFTRNLTIGSVGPDVQMLQTFLSQKGFMTLPTGTAYGKFGPLTQSALASFQRSRRITPVAGFFGPTTRAVVNREASTLALVGGTYGSGGSGNAPTTPRRTGGGGGGGGGSRGSSNNNNNNTTPQPTGNGECSDGNDNDNDGLTDFPIDPGCSSDTASEGSNPNTHITYAFKHYGAGGADGSANQCTGSGTSYTCTPISNFHNVIYPWVLDWRSNSLDPYMAKAYMDALPEGGRGMFSWVMDAANNSQSNFFREADNCKDSNGNTLTHTYNGVYPTVIDDAGNTVNPGGQVPYRCPWMDDWYSVVQPRWNTFFSQLDAIGGDVDVITIDNEVISDVSVVDWVKIPSILANPKFTQTDSKFSSGDLARGSMQSKIQGLASLLTNQTNCDAVNCTEYFTLFLNDWFHSYFNKATYDVARSYFPQVAVSNFSDAFYDFDTYRAPVHVNTTSCLSGSYCSNGSISGSHQQPGLLYGIDVGRAGSLFDTVHPYQNTHFSKIRQEVDYVKVSRLSNPDSGMAPLFADATRVASAPGLYAETIFHVLAAGSDFLNNWHDGAPRVSDEGVLSRAMDEFDAIAGFEDKETLMFDDTWLNNRLTQSNPSGWNDDFLLTGMRSGGRNVWRFTPETGHIAQISTISDTLISSDPPTFQTAQYTISFPQGVIYTPSNPQSSRGYWIVQPSGVLPIITNESDINVPPIATFLVWNINSAGSNYIVFDSSGSLDPDGPSPTFAFDFDNNGTFDDQIRAFDGTLIPVMNAVNPAFFGYRYTTAGPHTVTLRITDSDGASTDYRRTFTIPSTVCTGRHWECPITLTAFEDTNSNLAQVYNAVTEPINSFWRHTASAVVAFFGIILGAIIP